jgi:hypothetical protein
MCCTGHVEAAVDEREEGHDGRATADPRVSRRIARVGQRQSPAAG